MLFLFVEHSITYLPYTSIAISLYSICGTLLDVGKKTAPNMALAQGGFVPCSNFCASMLVSFSNLTLCF